MILEELFPPGVHAYVPPPEEGVAVSVVLSPAQIVELFTETVGKGVTVTVLVTVLLLHPFKE